MPNVSNSFCHSSGVNSFLVSNAFFNLELVSSRPSIGLVVPTASGLVVPTVGRRCAAPQCMAAALEPGDKVAVVGASGNVGKLVTLRLSDSFKVTGISRNPSRVRDFLPADKVELCQADLDDPAALEAALSSAAAVIICTGTTAFPTQA